MNSIVQSLQKVLDTEIIPIQKVVSPILPFLSFIVYNFFHTLLVSRENTVTILTFNHVVATFWSTVKFLICLLTSTESPRSESKYTSCLYTWFLTSGFLHVFLRVRRDKYCLGLIFDSLMIIVLFEYLTI